MRWHTLRFVAVVAVMICMQHVALASGWSRGLTVTSVGENNVGGKVVQFTVNEEIDRSVRCPDLTGYGIRDSVTLKGSLSLLLMAMASARKVDVFLTGTCDTTGMPIVLGVVVR
jgi:hypothetical protein